MPRALSNCQVKHSTVNYSQFSDGPNRVNDDWRASERYQSVAASIFDDEDRDFELFKTQCLTYVKAENLAKLKELISKWKSDKKAISLDFRDDGTGNTPAIIAASRNNRKILQLLLQQNADITLRNNQCKTALQLANRDLQSLMLSEKLHVDLKHAAWQGNFEAVKDMLHEDVDVNARNLEGMTPLLLATRDINFFEALDFMKNYEPIKVVKALLQRNVDVTLEDFDGKSTLHHLVQNIGFVTKQIAKQILGKTTKINQTDKTENSPLHTASKLGDVTIVEMLLSKGADVSCKNIAGKTPLHFAVIHGHDKVAELLLHHGADPKSCDDRGLSALDIAKNEENKDLIRILRRQTQEGLKIAEAGSKLRRQKTVYSDSTDGIQNHIIDDVNTNYKAEHIKSSAVQTASNDKHFGCSEEEHSELSERRESTFEYKVRPLEYHARESLHSPRKSATRGNSAKISSSLPESLFSPGSTIEILDEVSLTSYNSEKRKQSTCESLPNLKLGDAANKTEEESSLQASRKQTRLPSIDDSPTRKTFRERLLSSEAPPKAKSPKELLRTEHGSLAAPRERLTSFEGTPRVKNPNGRLPSLDSLPQEANATKKVMFVEPSQNEVSPTRKSPDKNATQNTSPRHKTPDRNATQNTSPRHKTIDRNATQGTSPRHKTLDRNTTQDTTSKSKTREVKETQNISSKPQNRNPNQDISLHRSAKNHLPSLPDSPKKTSPYIPSHTQLPTRATQSGVTLQKFGPDLSFVFEEKYDETSEHQQNIQDDDSHPNEEAAVPIHSLLLELGGSDNTSQAHSGIRKASGMSRGPSCRSVSAASSKSALSRRTSGGDEIAGEANDLEKKTMFSVKSKPSSISRKASEKTGLFVGKDFVTGFEAMQQIVDEYENAGNLEGNEFGDMTKNGVDGFVQESKEKLLPRGSSVDVFISDSKLPSLPNIQGPSYTKKHDNKVVLIPDVLVKSPEFSPTKETFPPLTGDKTSKENIYKQNVAFMDDVKHGKARENIVEDLFGKRSDLSKSKSCLAVPKNLGMMKKRQNIERKCSASTKKSCSAVKMPNSRKKIEKPNCNGKGKKCKKESAGQKQTLKSRKPDEVNLEYLNLLPGFGDCLNDDEFKDMFVYECFTPEIEVTSNGIQEVCAADVSRPQPTECNILPEKCSESPTFSNGPNPCNSPPGFNERYKSVLDFYEKDLGQEKPSTGGHMSSFDFKLLGVNNTHPELSIVNEENIFGTEQGEFSDCDETDNRKGVQGGSVDSCKNTPAREVLTSVSIEDEMTSTADCPDVTDDIKSQGHEGLTDSAELTTFAVQVESGAESGTKENIELDLNGSKTFREMTESTVAVQEESDVEPSRKEKTEVDLNNNNNFREMTEIMFASDIDLATSTGSGRRISNCSSIHRSSISTQTSTDGSECGDEELYDWVKGNVLDQGAYGTVYLALTNRGKMVAVKQVVLSRTHTKESEKQYKKLQEEIQMLKCLTHRYIVKFIGTTMEDNAVNIFMEYVPGGSLALVLKRFGPLPEQVFRRYTRQIISAIAYLHYNGIVHRDIKGANIMLTSGGVVKLIDFGCAKRLNLSLTQSSQLLHSCKGTPYWMAPEVIRSTGHDRKSDIWSIGCTVFEMATGKPPWYGCPYAAMYAIASEDTQIPTLPDQFSEAARDFVATCLKRNPEERCSAGELRRHEFIRMNTKGRKLPSLSYTH